MQLVGCPNCKPPVMLELYESDLVRKHFEKSCSCCGEKFDFIKGSDEWKFYRSRPHLKETDS